MNGRAALGVLLLAGAAQGGAAAQDTPENWEWVLDSPAEVATGDDLPESGWRFERMPPGWHVTTGPGVLLYDPDFVAEGRFGVESQIYLFPGESTEEYGLFLGGAALRDGPRFYTAFVLRRDGSAAVIRHRGGTTDFLVPWTAHDSIAAQEGTDVVDNLIRVDADAVSMSFSVNGTEVATVPRTEIRTDGRFGFRLGEDINVHLGSLDLIVHLAPPRESRPE